MEDSTAASTPRVGVCAPELPVYTEEVSLVICKHPRIAFYARSRPFHAGSSSKTKEKSCELSRGRLHNGESCQTSRCEPH